MKLNNILNTGDPGYFFSGFPSNKMDKLQIIIEHKKKIPQTPNFGRVSGKIERL
jgi:hypothetical protein